MPRLMTVDETVRMPRRGFFPSVAVSTAAASSSGSGLFENEMYTRAQLARKTPKSV